MEKKMMTIWTVIFVVFIFISARVSAIVCFDDGYVHDIDYEVNDDLYVCDDLAGTPTTVNIISGGAVSDSLCTYGNSLITIAGGLIGYRVDLWDSSHLTLFEGSIGAWVNASGNSRFNMDGGYIADYLTVGHNSNVSISDGYIGEGLMARENSIVSITGGSLGTYLWASDNSQIIIRGGWVGNRLDVYSNSRVLIYGTDFNLGFGKIAETAGRLTGTLESGELINLEFYCPDANASITLVPEPTTLLFLSLGAVLLRRKNRQ